MTAKKLAVFVSGRGSNLKALIQAQNKFSSYVVTLVVVSKKDAFAIEIARSNNIPFIILNKVSFLESTSILDTLKNHEIDFICLAGFLWKIPEYLIQAYPEKIINIHPSLLPKFGGKGMYGMKIHEAVVAKNEKTSGISIHFVNEEYDKGKILFQKEIELLKSESASSLATRILSLEHKYLPEVIDALCKGKK